MNLLLGLITSGVVGTMIFVILLIIRPITEGLFSKAWHYYSLLVPLIFLLGGTLLAGRLMNQWQYLSVERNGVMPSINEAVSQSQNHIAIPFNPIFAEPVEAVPITASHHLSAAQQFWEYIINAAPYIVFCWALGTVLFMGMSIKKYLKYRCLVLSQAQRYPDIDCQIPVVISPVAHTPMLIGIIKPTIVLPHIQLEDEELNMILDHELVHYKRKDILYKIIGFIANAVHWYNPVVYALNRQLNILCELSCDEKVALKMDAEDRKFYGETILQVLHHSTEQKYLADNFMFATNLCNSKKNIKRRLINMMNVKKIKKHVGMLSLVAVFFILGAGFVIAHLVDSAVPVYAASDLSYPIEDLYIQHPLALGEASVSDEADIWIGWFNSLSAEAQAYVSFRPPQLNHDPVYAYPIEESRPELQSPYTIAPSPEAISGGQFQWPMGSAHNRITSTFGQRVDPITGREEFHTGIDIPAPTDTYILAAADGYITFVGWNAGFGNTVIIYHGDDYSSLYAHCSRINVSVGQFVHQGEHIANVGSTGMSTGPNLHFEIRVDNIAIDPLLYLK